MGTTNSFIVFVSGFFLKYEQAAMANAKYSRRFQNDNEEKIFRQDHKYETDDLFLSGFVLLSFNPHSSVFLKMPSIGKNSEKMVTDGTHSREIFMFENVLPQIFEPWSGKHYAPLCYAITKTKGLVLEDLEAQGYRTCDMKKQLDLDHCRVALISFAKYHALSAKYIQDSNHVLIDTLKKPPVYSPSLWNYGYDLYDRFLNLAKTLVSRSAHQRLCEYKKEFKKIWLLISEIKENSRGFRVITHGNLWTNNIFFKYDDDGRVHEAKMIDWQQSRIALPVLDLVSFFLGSVPFEIFSAHRDTLLDLYIDTLNETLSALKCRSMYTRADLDSDLSRYKALFPMFASCTLQIVMTERDQPILNLQPSNEISCGKYPLVVAKWLNYFVENGIA